jgi:hypothetical protein
LRTFVEIERTGNLPMKTHKWRDLADKTFGPEKAEEIRKQAQDELEAEG